MKLIKFNPIIVIFLPLIAFIPIIKGVSEGFHSGGIDIIWDFITSAIHPSTNKIVIENALQGIQVTIAIGLLSWVITLVFGISLGFLSSKIFWKGLGRFKSFGRILRHILTIPRAIHEVIWGLLLLQLIGLNDWVAIIAIAIPYSCLMARVIADQLDTIEYQDLIAIRQTGSKSLASIATTLLPPVIPIIITYGGYRLECAIRGATLLGVFGLGGIGTELQLTLQSLEFREMWTSLWMLFLTIIFIEIALNSFNKILQKDINKTRLFIISGISILSIALLISISWLRFLDFQAINTIEFHSFSLPDIREVIASMDELDLIKLISETLLITILSVGIAIGTPPLILLILRGNIGKLFYSLLCLFLRLIPAPLTVLLLVLCTNPSVYVASLSIGLTNIGVMGRILKENIKMQNNSSYISLKSSGAQNLVAWLYGILGPKSKAYLAYGAFRLDVILRETAVIGVIGGVGLGWQLQESLSSFNWPQVTLISLVFIGLTLTGELIANKFNEYWLDTTTNDSLCISIHS